MTRDINKEILEGIKSIKQGEGKKCTLSIPSDIVSIRKNLHLSQCAFASLMGISKRTLEDWEQGRRHPSRSAFSLLRIAQKHPEVFKEI
jgi:putative transcriptional regulator